MNICRIFGAHNDFLFCVVSTKGIVSVLVALMAGKAEVKYHTDLLDAIAVMQLIEELGFGASLLEDDAVPQGKLALTVRPHPVENSRMVRVFQQP